MSEENLAMTVAADPQLMKQFIERAGEPAWEIPRAYEREVEDILKSPIALIPNIDTPEDYKTLVRALHVLGTYKQRVAVIRHHLKALHFSWDKLHRKACKFVETKYYKELNAVRADTKKSIVVNALEPLTTGLEEVETLLSGADIAQKHLEDLNWAVKNSCDLVTQYFNSIKTYMPREI